MSLAESDRHAETVPCTMCEAPAGSKCVSVFNREKVRAFPHSVRLIAANQPARRECFGLSSIHAHPFGTNEDCPECTP